ncbi:MAG: choice-of-anchor D domain-containing protein [Carboxylicivirga sp.]|jgi:hypothetical protein|nr:choice-of-anchor D domain-containing protein [Carboxylicivirga sp.]
MVKQVPLFLFMYFMTCQLNGQSLSMTFGKSSTPPTTITNGATCSLGNFGPGAGGINVFELVVTNTDATQALTVSNLKASDNDERIGIFILNTSFSVAPGDTYTIQVFYNPTNNYTKAERQLSFTTNDAANTNVNITFVANLDKGELKLSLNDTPLSTNVIDLGDVKINSTVTNKLTLSNVGKGYMEVEPADNIVSDNNLTFSYTKKEVLVPGSNLNNNITLATTKKGPFNYAFTHKTIQGKVAEHTISIKGKVIAPIATLTYEGRFITHGEEVTLPVNNHEPAEYKIKIHNIGDDNLTLGSIRIAEGDIYNEFNLLNEGSNTIVPNAEKGIVLKCVPNHIGQKRIKLTFNSNGYETEDLVMYVNLLVKAPILRITDAFGTVYMHNQTYTLPTSENGTMVKTHINLTNIGNRDLAITSLKEHIDYAFLEIANTPKLNLIPGESTQVDLQYTPPVDRNHNETAILSILSNNEEEDNITFPLMMNNAYADIDVKKGSTQCQNNYFHDFGSTSVNTPNRQVFTIINSGLIDLDLNSISIVDDINGYFTIASEPENKVIAPGGSAQVEVQFAPTTNGSPYTANLEIVSNDYQDSRFIIQLSGWAIKPSLRFFHTQTNNSISNNSKIDWGTLSHHQQQHSPHIMSLSIKNTEHDVLQIRNFKVVDSDGVTTTVSNANAINGDYEHNEQVDFSLQFDFTTPGAKAVQLLFTTNDRTNNDFNITIVFTTEMPILQVYSPNLLDNNAEVDFGSEATKVVTLKNIGTELFYIKNVSISGADADAFVVDVKEPWVNEGEAFAFDVELKAGTVGKKQAVLIIETNDLANPLFKIQLVADADEITGIEDKLNDHFKIYPNPIVNYFTIENRSNEEAEVNIYNLKGTKVFSIQTIGRITTVYPELESGMYIYEIIQNGKRITKMITKQ